MTEQVIPEVILRNEDGSSVLDSREPITAENIGKYRVNEDVATRASQMLENLGFEVVQKGPTSVTISGDKQLFEDRFQTSLQVGSGDVVRSEIGDVRVPYYVPKTPLYIPQELAPLVADVVIPTPPQYFP
jgi:carbamoylphosphate synthase large subunit